VCKLLLITTGTGALSHLHHEWWGPATCSCHPLMRCRPPLDQLTLPSRCSLGTRYFHLSIEHIVFHLFLPFLRGQSALLLLPGPALLVLSLIERREL